MACDVCDGSCNCENDDLIPDKVAYQTNKKQKLRWHKLKLKLKQRL